MKANVGDAVPCRKHMSITVLSSILCAPEEHIEHEKTYSSVYKKIEKMSNLINEPNVEGLKLFHVTLQGDHFDEGVVEAKGDYTILRVD